jgi:hypothetical protein
MTPSTLLNRMCHVYRLLLRAYPKTFREAYGAEMARVFRDRGLEIARSGGARGLVRYALLTSLDWLQTVVQERTVFMSLNLSTLRWIFLACLILDIALVKRMSTPALSTAPLPFALLIMYGLLVLLVTTNRSAIGTESTLGLASGMIMTVWTTCFSFLPTSGTVSVLVGSSAMAIIFACWGMAGYRAARRTGLAGSGWLAGCWSSIVCVLVKVTCSLALFSLGISSLTAANTLAVSGQHLLEGPVLGAILGALGGLAARFSARSQSPPRAIIVP